MNKLEGEKRKKIEFTENVLLCQKDRAEIFTNRRSQVYNFLLNWQLA